MSRMVFGTSLRVAGDSSQPLNRRVTNLVNAVEKFRALPFHDTLGQLHLATGSQHGDWTSEQLDAAVVLIEHAHVSWIAYLQQAEAEARQAKGQPEYVPLNRWTLARVWRSVYFNAERRALWRLDVAEAPW